MRLAARVAALALLVLPLAAARAADDAAGAPRDAEFGVTAQGAIGLERRVAMYQWTRDGASRTWSATPIETTGQAPGRTNPAELPLRSRQWLPGKVSLDGHPVAPSAVDALAEWEPLRPDFSALPGNLSATFQPEGDGLGSAANPVHPEVGDLRITWRALRMPATRGPLVLRDGQWELREAGAGAAEAAVAGTRGTEAPRRGTWAWTVLGMIAGALVAGVLLLLRRRR